MFIALVLALALVKGDPAFASERAQIGKPGAWKETIAMASNGEAMFTVERDGWLYKSTVTGDYKKIGKKPDFADTRLMFADENSVYTIEKDGSLFAVSIWDGTWKRVGAEGAWKDVSGGFVRPVVWNPAALAAGETGFVRASDLWTVEAGSLVVTNLSTGARKVVGKKDFGEVVHLLNPNPLTTRFDEDLGAKEVAFTVSKDESVHALNLESGHRNLLAGSISGSVAIAAEGFIYAFDINGELKRVESLTGSATKVAVAAFRGVRFAAWVGQSVMILDGEGTLWRVSP